MPPSGLLGSLSQEKQDRAAEEYTTLGGEVVTLYIEDGARKFGQMLRDFAESTGLPKSAQSNCS